jgi:hypothetical protein
LRQIRDKDHLIAALIRTSTAVAGLIFLFLPFLSAPIAEERRCKPDSVLATPPSKILIIPLLRKDPDSAESERWAERPAAEIEAFYRTRFSAQIRRLRGIRVWEDFYREADKLTQRPGLFDRVILIGHGGFDGPVLNGQIIQNALTIEGDHAKATRIFEAQPGLAEIFTLTYDPKQHPEFSRFMENHWNELSRKDTTEIRKVLTNTERRLQPLDAACMARQCPPDSLAAIPNDADRDIRRGACESICRVPLFTLHAFEAPLPDRFRHFVQTLRLLVHPNGSILLGMCNPGSKVPERESPWEIGGVLVHSKLASGPHETYVHLLAAATERTVAGPIGKTSAEDVVDRIPRFEEGRPQRYLRIVVPDRRCPP